MKGEIFQEYRDSPANKVFRKKQVRLLKNGGKKILFSFLIAYVTESIINFAGANNKIISAQIIFVTQQIYLNGSA
jgi:hypothetical protein